MKIGNEAERILLREGGLHLAELLQALAQKTIPGVRTFDLEMEARRIIEAFGDTPAFLNYKPHGAKRPYPAALCVSINDAIVHGIPNEKDTVVQDGDVVSLDCGLIHGGFITDAAITVVAGTQSEEKARLIRAASEALDAGIAQARAGNHMGDIGAAIEAVGEKYGYGSPRELGGHSVGRSVHEEPFVPNFGVSGQGVVLSEGMVLAIEPMFTLGSSKIKLDPDGYTYRTRDSSIAVHMEHTVIIGKSPEILTKIAQNKK